MSIVFGTCTTRVLPAAFCSSFMAGYAKIDGPLDFSTFADATRVGRSYVSDGRSHLMNFAVNGLVVGTNDSELTLSGAQTVAVTAKVAAYLPPRTRRGRRSDCGAIADSATLLAH